MGQRGSMFISALFMVAFVALVSVPVFHVASREAQGGAGEQLATIAHYVAEAGLTIGQESLVGGVTPASGSLGTGSYALEVTHDSSTEKYTIVSTGVVGKAVQTLSVRLRPMTLYEVLVPPLDMATFGDISLGLTGSATVYGDVGTNAAVIPIKGNATVIDGETHTNLGRIYPLPPFPDCTPATAPIPEDRSWNGEALDDESDNVYATIQVGDNKVFGTLGIDASAADVEIWADTFSVPNGEIVITGDNDVSIYVTTLLELDGCTVIQDPDHKGTIAIYYAGPTEVRLAGNSSLVFEGVLYAEVANFSFLGNANFKGALITGGATVDLAGTSDSFACFEAAIYAPNSDVTGLGTARVHGAIVGKTFVGKGNLEVRYDPDLNHPDPIGAIDGQQYAREYWRYGR